MRKDIGQNLDEDLLVLISEISADNITKRNLTELLIPDEVKPIIDFANQVNQIQLIDQTLKSEKEIARYCSPKVFQLANKWVQWLFTFHWVIRHWNLKHRIPSYKIPQNKNPNDPASKPNLVCIRDVTKPLGDLLCSVLRILEYNPSNMAQYNKENIHYMDIFTLIAWEIYDLNFTSPSSGGIRAKADEVSKVTKWLKAYRYENWKDYRKDLDSNRYPYLFGFIDMVVSMANRDRDFAKRFLIQTGQQKGLIEAFGSFSSSFRKPNNIVFMDSNEDELTIRIGRGKAVLTHTKSEFEKLIFEGLTEQGLQALKHFKANDD